MRSKIIAFILLAVIFTGIISTNCNAENQEVTAGEFEELIDGILAWKQEKADAASLQDFIDTGLSPNAGKSPTEWYIVALRQYKNSYDYTAYQSSLNTYTENNTNEKATDLQRMAIAYTAIGADNDFIKSTIENATDDLGIMSNIYGLILLDSGAYTSDTVHRDDVIKSILSLILPDGGWALTGKVSDVDVTAMAVQALAPYYKFDDVKASIDNALALLSERQLENGDYASWGTSNCESTAQVLAALSTLHIDFRSDGRFIKNGNSVIDGLLLYRLSDGSFSHTRGGNANEFASVQALYSLVAAWRNANAFSSLYIFTDKIVERETAPSEPENSVVSETSVSEAHSDTESFSEISYESSSSESSESSDTTLSTTSGSNTSLIETASAEPLSTSFRKWAYIIIGLLALLAIGFLIITKKWNIKNLLITFLLIIIALITIFSVNIQSIDEYYQIHIDDIEPDSETVFISIRCDTAVGKTNAAHIPADGCILDTKEYVLRDGDTVFELLERTVKHNKIQMEYEGAKSNSLGTVYIKGINYLYQYDLGDLSGWMYKVNGKFANVGCSDYNLSDGDVIEWEYTCDLGTDLSEK